MSRDVLYRITSELTEIGHSLTSYAELGLGFDETALAKLREVIGGDVFGAEAAVLAAGTAKKDMIVAQGDETMLLSAEFVRPVIETLFRDSPQALGSWALYGVNRYDRVGGAFEPHMDPPGSTVAIVTFCGVRTMDIYRRDPDQTDSNPETFRDIEHTIELGPGSVMLIDGQFGPPHAATCLEAPSISAVVDVYDLLRA